METKFFYFMQIISAILSVFLILLHSPKGDGMASIGAASQLFASQKSTEKGLNKVTYFFVGIFILSTFMMSFGLKLLHIGL
ncbi:MAG: preprotein translocase subunit SecG [Candidatus Gastranaerophilales bacterium]|nr:preprotein translocase subunit SecG [Candidatus Gastranaerophilales bacterium]